MAPMVVEHNRKAETKTWTTIDWFLGKGMSSAEICKFEKTVSFLPEKSKKDKTLENVFIL